jgi:hypothetical protein
MAESSSCKDLSIGETLRVRNTPSKSKTGIEMKYTLKRISNSAYDIYLNPNFKYGKGYDGPFPKTGEKKIKKRELNKFINKQYRARAQRCFEALGPKLYDGYYRKLNLKIWEKGQHTDIAKPPKVNIKIVESGARSNSRNYSATVTCATIVHEAFHLLGLVDEYEEKWNNWNPNILSRIFKPFSDDSDLLAFNCRSIGSDISIMRNSYLAAYNRNVLHSKHVDTIIYPNCEKKNDTFYRCSKNAYRTSKGNGGVFGCRKNTPDICQTSQWYGI